MSIPISQQEQSLQEQIDHANEKIVAMEKKLRALDDEQARLQGQRAQYQLLDDICTPLEKLGKMGAADLFREATGQEPEQLQQQVRGVVARFQQHFAAIEKLRSVQKASIQDELAKILLLSDQIEELQEVAENQQIEYELKRQAREITYHASVLPWSMQEEDERRFRKILFAFIFFAVVFAGLINILRPPVEKDMGIVVPERIARIIKKKQEAKPEEQKPAEKAEEKKEEKPEEKTAEKTPSREIPRTAATEAQKPRNSAETKGVLAFKNNFAELMEDSSQMKLGASARISHKANRAASGGPQHSIIVAQGTGSSGGINTSTLNRQSEGSGGQRIVGEGVKFTRVESAAGTGSDRPLSKGGGPSRTDEEIQIVFDRYKSALYRIYNRELRNNPTLRGKMILRIVIEPDGSVSACTVKSSDLDSPALSADIVNRVLNFNFGPKQGVPAITILYPIDFLPAN